MKKLMVLLPLFATVTAHAQLSVWLDNKYGFKIPGSYDQTGVYGNVTGNSAATTTELKKFDPGNGYQVGAGLRYNVMENFGVELGYAFLAGQKDKVTGVYTGSGSSPNTNNATESLKARMSRVMLGVCYTGSKKLSPMMRMGIIMASGKVVVNYSQTSTATSTTFNPNPPYNTMTVTTTTTDEQESKYYGGLSLGFYAALGVNYKITENISAALLLDIVMQDFSPKKGSLTKSTHNGVDQLPGMLLSSRETEFVSTYTDISSSTPPNNVTPSKSPRFSIPVSSFGPSISITYTFGKKNSGGSAQKNP